MGTNTTQKRITPIFDYMYHFKYGHCMTFNYHESIDIQESSGILFNRASPVRGLDFITHKLTNALVRIKLGKQKKLRLGKINAKRNRGFAGDFVETVRPMNTDDDIVATSRTITARYMLTIAFNHVGISIMKIISSSTYNSCALRKLMCYSLTQPKLKISWLGKSILPWKS